MRDFLSFPNFGTILLWPISLLIISSGSSGLFKFGCFNYVFLKIYYVTSLKKAHQIPSIYKEYNPSQTFLRNVSQKPSEESPPPLPLFQCCSNDVDFSFDFFPTCKTTLGRGYGGKKGSHCPNVIV